MAVQLGPYKDPLSGNTSQDLVEMAQAAKRLGITPEELSKLDDDWLARAGFDPRVVKSTNLKGLSVGGTYYPRVHTPEHIKDDLSIVSVLDNQLEAPTPGGIFLAPKSQLENEFGTPTPWDILAHESRHRGLDIRHGYTGVQEGVIREGDRDYGSPAAQAEQQRALKEGLYNETPYPIAAAIRNTVERDKAQGSTVYPIPKAGPLAMMQGVMRGELPASSAPQLPSIGKFKGNIAMDYRPRAVADNPPIPQIYKDPLSLPAPTPMSAGVPSSHYNYGSSYNFPLSDGVPPQTVEPQINTRVLYGETIAVAGKIPYNHTTSASAGVPDIPTPEENGRNINTVNNESNRVSYAYTDKYPTIKDAATARDNMVASGGLKVLPTQGNELARWGTTNPTQRT